jgi:hypothetical protein
MLRSQKPSRALRSGVSPNQKRIGEHSVDSFGRLGGSQLLAKPNEKKGAVTLRRQNPTRDASRRGPAPRHREQSLPSSGSSGGKLLGPKESASLRGDAVESGPRRTMFEQTGTNPACRLHARHEGLGNESRMDCTAQAVAGEVTNGSTSFGVLRSGRTRGPKSACAPSSPLLAVDRHARLSCRQCESVGGRRPFGPLGTGSRAWSSGRNTARLAAVV